MARCAGCGDVVEVADRAVINCDHPLGYTVLIVHRSQECGKAALARHPEHEMLPGNRWPYTAKQIESGEIGDCVLCGAKLVSRIERCPGGESWHKLEHPKEDGSEQKQAQQAAEVAGR